MKFTETRKELAEKYFGTFTSTLDIYAKGNMGIITLLSDVQHGCEDSNEILNDIKCILSNEE